MRRALAIDPTYVRAKAFLSGIYHQLVIQGWGAPGDREMAIALAGDVIAAATDDPDAPLWAAPSLGALVGDFPAAFAALHRAARLHQSSALVLNALGHVHCFANDPEPAIVYFERAMHLSPLDPALGLMLLGIGRAHLLAGRSAEALPFLRSAVQEISNSQEAPRMLIHALTRLEMVNEVRVVAVRLTQVRPDHRFRNAFCHWPKSTVRSSAQSTYRRSKPLAFRNDRPMARRGPRLSGKVQRFPDSGVRPCRWTISGDYFDRLPGGLIFELRGAEIGQGRM